MKPSNVSVGIARANEVLRERLQDITTGRSANDWPRMIAALRPEHPHSIREIHLGVDERYNCFAFALGLYQSRDYFRVAHSRRDVFANAAFVLYLIREGLLRSADRAAPGEKLILYFQKALPKHAGRLREERVTSKWGNGKYFEHAVYEVPASYGCETECYGSPTLRDIESEFLCYAAKQGVPISGLLPGSAIELTSSRSRRRRRARRP